MTSFDATLGTPPHSPSAESQRLSADTQRRGRNSYCKLPLNSQGRHDGHELANANDLKRSYRDNNAPSPRHKFVHPRAGPSRHRAFRTRVGWSRPMAG